MYTNGNGFRNIARILSKVFDRKIYYQTVVKWLRARFASVKEVEEVQESQIHNKEIQNKEIDIIEMDELFTYIKKKEIRSGYGLLLIGENLVCVRFK